MEAEYEKKRISIIMFLSSLEYRESYYCRLKSQWKYLLSDLSISKLYNAYMQKVKSEAHCDEVPKKSYFRLIFNTRFNYGFSSLKQNVCSTCLSLKEQIKVEVGKSISLVSL